jgi:hypothetical protein
MRSISSSRMPSYWNLIRGLQNIDACILTHFDHDVLPGLQTIMHRKTMPSTFDGRSCKPDIGGIFLNRIQRTKLSTVSTPSASQLQISLAHCIDQFTDDIKQLEINTFDLVRQSMPNKTTIEPINLYKKIAFGSLDLYILHPMESMADNDKLLGNLQKVNKEFY